MTLFWKLAKPFLHEKTQDKFCFNYEEDNESLKDVISKYVPEDKFPKEYGGLLPDEVEVRKDT